MAMPLGDLGWEVSSIILKLLDIDDAVCLYNALQFQYKNGTRYDHNFLFNWIDITQLERGNMLTNTHFSVRMRSDPNQNRNPINLRPSPASGLPQTRTYYDLLRDPLVLTPAHVLRQKKTEDLRVLRHSLLFTSRKFREGLDIPGERSRRILKLTLGSNSTYPQILQNLPNGKTREDVTACRLRDDRSNTEFQEQALMKVLFRMQADPLFLPRTCRKCCIHTRQNGQDSNYAEANGVVYCTTCMRKHLLATGYIAFDEIFLINRDISLDAVSMRSGGILTTLSRHYVSKEDSEILANCFAGMSLFDLQSRLFAAPSAYGGRDAAQKFNFCSQATYHAIKWYTMRTSSGYPLGYRLPNTTSQGAMKDNLGMKLTSKSSVLKIYRAMARHYDRLSKNYRQGFQYTKRLGEAIRCAARFWHEQLFDCGLIFVHVLCSQLRMPERLFGSDLDYTSGRNLPSNSTISVNRARDVVSSYFGCSLGQMAAAMMSLIGTPTAISFEVVVGRAAQIIVDIDSDRVLPSLVAYLAVLGKNLPSQILGRPAYALPEFWSSHQAFYLDFAPSSMRPPTVSSVATGAFRAAYPSEMWLERPELDLRPFSYQPGLPLLPAGHVQQRS